MKITIVGGTGLIGSKIASNLSNAGHDVLVAAPTTGVDTITGQGLAKALENAEVVIDVANSPSFEEKAARDFFETSGRNLLSEELKQGVKHHIALSVIGTERLLEVGYFRAKQLQENLIKESGVPYSIVHSTQFFEFLGNIAGFSMRGDEVYLSQDGVQPIAAEDVAAKMTEVALGQPAFGIIEIAGPEIFGLAEIVKRYLSKMNDPRKVNVDATAKYFGASIDEKTLLPHGKPRLGAVRFDNWMKEKLKAVTV